VSALSLRGRAFARSREHRANGGSEPPSKTAPADIAAVARCAESAGKTRAEKPGTIGRPGLPGPFLRFIHRSNDPRGPPTRGAALAWVEGEKLIPSNPARGVKVPETVAPNEGGLPFQLGELH
jgi:hypothetical protein